MQNFKVYSTQNETKQRHFTVILHPEGFRLYSTIFFQTTVYSFDQIKGSILNFTDVNRLQEKLQVQNQVKVRRNEMIFIEFVSSVNVAWSTEAKSPEGIDCSLYLLILCLMV